MIHKCLFFIVRYYTFLIQQKTMFWQYNIIAEKLFKFHEKTKNHDYLNQQPALNRDYGINAFIHTETQIYWQPHILVIREHNARWVEWLYYENRFCNVHIHHFFHICSSQLYTRKVSKLRHMNINRHVVLPNMFVHTVRIQSIFHSVHID